MDRFRITISYKLVPALVFCLLLCVVGCANKSALAPGHLRLTVINIGQGDSLLIQTEDAVLLVDAGTQHSGRQILKAMRQNGVRRIDLAVLTHPHEDHIGALTDIGDKIPIGQVLDSGFPYASPVRTKVLRWITKNKVPLKRARQGQKIRLGQTLEMQALWPRRGFVRGTASDPNNNSVVLRINHGSVHLLLTGDIGDGPESALLASGFDLRSDFLKVGHQGSRTSSSAAFLDRVRPKVAAICVGRTNSYGHPHPETLQRLRSAGVRIYQTDKDGELVFESDGTRFWKQNSR